MKANKYHVNYEFKKMNLKDKFIFLKAELRGAELWVTNLKGTDLRKTNFKGADLRRTDLKGSFL